MIDRLYVLVRGDLPKSYQAVQACHAACEFMKTHPGFWLNDTLVLLQVANEECLRGWLEKASEELDSVTPFFEPDLQDSPMTAFAAAGTIARTLFKGLPLV